MIVDNKNGTDTVYWIQTEAPYYGETPSGFVTTTAFDVVIYTDRNEWLADLEALGIEGIETE